MIAYKIVQLENKDANLMTKVNSLAHDKSALEKKNGELASKLNQVKTSQTQLKSKDDQLAAKVEDLITKNTALMKENDDLEAKDMVLMANITSLTDKDSALETKLSGLESQLKAKVKLEKYRKQTIISGLALRSGPTNLRTPGVRMRTPRTPNGLPIFD